MSCYPSQVGIDDKFYKDMIAGLKEKNKEAIEWLLKVRELRVLFPYERIANERSGGPDFEMSVIARENFIEAINDIRHLDAEIKKYQNKYLAFKKKNGLT